MVVFNYFAGLWDSYSLAVITAFIVFLFITFILDGLKFSDNKFLRYAQYFILSSLFLYIYLNFFSLPITYASENDPALTANITITKDSMDRLNDNVATIGSSLNHLSNSVASVGSNLGLGATVGGLSAATASALKGTAMPPAQRVGAIIVTGVVAASIHVGVTAINRGKKNEESSISENASSNNHVNSNFDINSPLELNETLSSNYVEDLLYSILSLNICTLLLFLFFLLSLISRLLIINRINLNFIDKVLPIAYSEKIKKFLNSIYGVFGKTNNIYSILLIIVLLISCLGSIYFTYELINNFEVFSKDYLDIINKHKK